MMQIRQVRWLRVMAGTMLDGRWRVKRVVRRQTE
jgi:hypothetical protein